jgi:hypothetical protein
VKSGNWEIHNKETISFVFIKSSIQQIPFSPFILSFCFFPHCLLRIKRAWKEKKIVNHARLAKCESVYTMRERVAWGFALWLVGGCRRVNCFWSPAMHSWTRLRWARERLIFAALLQPFGLCSSWRARFDSRHTGCVEQRFEATSWSVTRTTRDMCL